MKKFITIVFTIILLITAIIPFNAFAAENTEYDTYFTQEEFEALEHTYAESISIQPYATGLIVSNELGIAKSGSNLLISGYTKGTSAVVKCGFTKVVIERKKASDSKWSTYTTYKSLYSDSNYYSIYKSVAVESGYQYRVTAVHYAKKSLLSTQKIEATTGYLTF